MFTGIIECMGRVESVRPNGNNIDLEISSPISHALKVDQSVAHDGVCLTVTAKDDNSHRVTVIQESLQRSHLADIQEGDFMNLERSMKLEDRLDGHWVQGHVDDVGVCKSVTENDGSWVISFRYDPRHAHLLVDKGSICINGVSLTLILPSEEEFRVAIIPYTWEHTNLNSIKPGKRVNLEFDILGKFLARYLKLYNR